MNADEQRQINLAMAALCGYPVVIYGAMPDDAPPFPYVRDWGGNLSGDLSLVTFADAATDWSPVTDPAQAADVAEALRRQGWRVFPAMFPDNAITLHGYPYWCQIYCCDNADVVVRTVYAGSMDSLAEAICAAAAKTLESEAGI